MNSLVRAIPSGIVESTRSSNSTVDEEGSRWRREEGKRFFFRGTVRGLRDTNTMQVREPRGNHKGGGDDDDDDDDENDGNDNGQREEKVHGQTKKQISKEEASPRGCWLVAVAMLYARDCD